MLTASRHATRVKLRCPPTLAAGLLALVLTSCGGGSPSAPGPAPAVASPLPAFAVQSVTDGDTVRVAPNVSGSASVRFLNIDAPELGTQEPWGSRSREALALLIPPGTAVNVIQDRETVDSFGRALGHVRRVSDGLVANREQLRQGHAALYVLWPNVASFEDYRSAQREARAEGRGIWDPAGRLPELPFEHRFRTQGRVNTQPVGDWFTRFYVDPASYRLVDLDNRVFFGNDGEALGAGFRACPREGNMYSTTCFTQPR